MVRIFANRIAGSNEHWWQIVWPNGLITSYYAANHVLRQINFLLSLPVAVCYENDVIASLKVLDDL